MNNSRPEARKLRIGIIAPPWIACPPTRYGGTELVVDTLARGLAAGGHDVTLFATGDSTCPVRREWVYEQALGSGIGTTAIELNHAAAAYDALNSCDVIHDHTLAGLFITQINPRIPTVTTNHGPFVDLLLVAISADQASRAPSDIPIAGMIHHGLDLDQYPFSPNASDYFACIGRFHPDKGIDRAITVARRAGVALKIAAKMQEPPERDYYTNIIKPRLGNGIDYIGEVDHQTKVELLGSARALINTICWPEPFGLVAIEALACGTPVIATNWGAMPELITHGVTGYIANTTTNLAKATVDIDRIDRWTCRAASEDRFSMTRMAQDHELLFRRVIRNWPQPTP
jgi:glycosyltransferase involved in cell wall biosynthesis